MLLDCFTNKFQFALANARTLALKNNNKLIGPFHLMKSLLTEETGSVRFLLSSILKTNFNQFLDVID